MSEPAGTELEPGTDIGGLDPEYVDATLYTTDGDGTWRVPATMHTATVAGYKGVEGLFQLQEDGTWLRLWANTHTPPQTPQVAVTLVDGTRTQLSVTVTLPGRDTPRRVIVKAGIGAPASTPDGDDGLYFHHMVGGEPWSTWFTDPYQYTYNQDGLTATKQLPCQGQPDLAFEHGETIHITAWTQDQYGVWSAPGTAHITTLAATAPPHGVNHYLTAIIPNTVDTWDNLTGSFLYRSNPAGKQPVNGELAWTKSDRNPAYWHFQGGAGQAQWATIACYPSARQVLAYADGIESVVMPLMRRYNTDANMVGGYRVHDASWPANRTTTLRMFTHSLGQIPPATTHFTGLSVLDNTPGHDTVLPAWEPANLTMVPLPANVVNKLATPGTGGVAFWDAGSSKAPAATSKWEASFAMPNTVGGEAKLCKTTLSGYLLVRWWSMKANPWPEADPTHENFKPVGIDHHTWENANA